MINLHDHLSPINALISALISTGYILLGCEEFTDKNLFFSIATGFLLTGFFLCIVECFKAIKRKSNRCFYVILLVIVFWITLCCETYFWVSDAHIFKFNNNYTYVAPIIHIIGCLFTTKFINVYMRVREEEAKSKEKVV